MPSIPPQHGIEGLCAVQLGSFGLPEVGLERIRAALQLDRSHLTRPFAFDFAFRGSDTALADAVLASVVRPYPASSLVAAVIDLATEVPVRAALRFDADLLLLYGRPERLTLADLDLLRQAQLLQVLVVGLSPDGGLPAAS